MNQYIDGPLEFIYTTPDEHEEEIFEDHLMLLKFKSGPYNCCSWKKIY